MLLLIGMRVSDGLSAGRTENTYGCVVVGNEVVILLEVGEAWRRSIRIVS